VNAARLEFGRESYDSADVSGLVQAQEVEVRERGDAGDLSPPRESSVFEPPDGAFIVMRDGGRAIGCGGFSRFDVTRAELKRMYVAPDVRGRGLGRVLLRRIEEEAKAFGYDRLVLETITLMSEAMRLYESEGYTAIPPYGPYAQNPTSRCFEKSLGGQAPSIGS
jgi:putative acetyltransferase